jgi:nucleotide-binding universal stress UspA family protein
MIVKKARESGADLVVMGTHGASGFEKLFLGSITEKVLHQIDVPLLAVTRPAGTAVPGAERAAAPRFRTILLAVDFDAGTPATAEHALALAQRYGARLLVLHVYPPPSTFHATAAATRVMDDDLARHAGQHELGKLVPASVRDTVPTEFLALKGDPFEVIDRVVRERGADLVVMGARSRGLAGLGWLGCTCHKVIRAGASPVLAVRKGA